MAAVRVSPEARGVYERLVTDSVLPEGSVVALIHGDANRPGRVFVMEKAAGTWRYRALTSAGIPAPTPDSLCQECHAGGVADFLFGLPRSRAPAALP
jgi:hypothetical protein